jgi:hypothetical protein
MIGKPSGGTWIVPKVTASEIISIGRPRASIGPCKR